LVLFSLFLLFYSENGFILSTEEQIGKAKKFGTLEKFGTVKWFGTVRYVKSSVREKVDARTL
jgi:hypothetical protein